MIGLGRRAWLGSAVVFGLLACGGSESTSGPSESTTGALEVRASTTGDTLDSDGYRVTLDGGIERSLGPSESIIYEDVAEGDHEVTISGVQANCSPGADATRTVTVTAGSTATTAFDIACRAALFDRIVFHRADGAGDGDLLAVEADGSGLVSIRDNDGLDVFPSLSPDGTHVAFSDRSGADSEIAVVAVDGSGFDHLTDNDTFDGSQPSWSPEGSRMAFSSYRDGDSEIYLMDADGSNVVQLTDNDVFDAGPAWSPDGERIAFTSDMAGGRDIHVVDVDGGNLTRLTDDPSLERSPAWSPDGERIAFERSSAIYVMDADGTGVELLVDVTGGSDNDPSWSPDGSRIVFTSNPDGDHDLFVVNSDGSDVSRLLAAPSTDERLGSWGPARH